MFIHGQFKPILLYFLTFQLIGVAGYIGMKGRLAS